MMPLMCNYFMAWTQERGKINLCKCRLPIPVIIRCVNTNAGRCYRTQLNTWTGVGTDTVLQLGVTSLTPYVEPLLGSIENSFNIGQNWGCLIIWLHLRLEVKNYNRCPTVRVIVTKCRKFLMLTTTNCFHHKTISTVKTHE